MVCNKCGAQNLDAAVFCGACGTPIPAVVNKPSRGKKTALIVTLCAVFVLLLSALAVLLLGGVASVEGPWHSEELQQALRFHDDGTVVVRTPAGDFEGNYVYDNKAAQGIITLKGEAISFAVVKDVLTLTWGGVTSTFGQGDMDIALVTPSPTPAPTPSPTPDGSVPADATATPEVASSATPSAAPSVTPAFSFIPIPLISGLLPLTTSTPTLVLPSFSVVIPGDIFSNITSPVVGTWACRNDPTYKLEFLNDGSFVMYCETEASMTGTYAYNADTASGSISYMFYTNHFTIDGDVLTLDGTELYDRVK